MYIIMFIIKRDELRDTEDEVKVLENLLNEAWERRRNILKKHWERRRNILKKQGIQGWWDWICELVGY